MKCMYNGMYGSSNVVLGISSSSLLWELALVDNKSVSLLVSILYRCLIRMNDKLRIIQFQYIFLINRIIQTYLKRFIIWIGVRAPQCLIVYLPH